MPTAIKPIAAQKSIACQYTRTCSSRSCTGTVGKSRSPSHKGRQRSFVMIHVSNKRRSRNAGLQPPTGLTTAVWVWQNCCLPELLADFRPATPVRNCYGINCWMVHSSFWCWPLAGSQIKDRICCRLSRRLLPDDGGQ